MSLLDDVSLMITPNGVAEDVLFGVLPQPIIGTELVTNGDFATDSDWTIVNNTGTDSEITGGYLRIKTDGAYTDVTQTSVTVADKQYKLVYTVLSSDGGNLGVVTQGNITSAIPSSVGTHTYYFTSHSTSFILKRRSGALDVTIDNVSVKEYTSADMDFTRATTATRVNSSALITSVATGVPRIDYTGGGCPHILSEPQRTNLLTYSENFSDSSWTKQTGTVITANQAVAPDGNTTAYKVVSDGSNGIFESAISVDGIVARSVYLRSITGTLDVKLKDPNTTVTTKTCSLTTTWQRFELTEDNGDAANLQGIWVDDIPADGIYMWGAQLELGSYATSYIPTSGSTVTRNEDTFTRTGIADLINSTEGVLYAEIAALANDGTIRYLSINDGTGNNRVTILYYSLSNNIRAIVTSGNVTQMDKNSSVTSITDFHKVAIKWKVNDFALWIDGVEVATDTSGSAPIGLNTLSFDIAGSGNFYGKVRNLQVYKTALSDSQLTSLTT
jgi:hypothetical protein